MDCFAEPFIGPAKGRTGWLAMTESAIDSQHPRMAVAWLEGRFLIRTIPQNLDAILKNPSPSFDKTEKYQDHGRHARDQKIPHVQVSYRFPTMLPIFG